MSNTVLELKSVTKCFYKNTVLNDVDFKLERSEIHAIIGKNGAGKSTIVKILAGLYQIDSGTILFEDKKVSIKRPIDSIRLGIYTLQQEPYLFDHLTVAENIYVNNLPAGGKFKNINRDRLLSKAQDFLNLLGFPIQSGAVAGQLNLRQKRMVELARVLCRDAKVIILDEPTASLSEIETNAFLNYIKELKNKGVSIIYISQRFKEIVKLADRITVLRDGAVAGCLHSDSADFQALVKMMWGECLRNRYPKLAVKQGREIFAVENLYGDSFLNDVSFSVAKGEIVGITGLVGSGRTKLAKLIVGMEQKKRGGVYIDRLEAFIKSPKDAIKLGVAYVTEDRFEEGVFANLSVFDNAFSAKHYKDERFIFDASTDSKIFKKYADKINIDIGSPLRKIVELSGGQQQKIMIMRCFLAEARIIIFDEPTHAMDIASKVDIYNLMNDLIRKEAGIILISSDIEELVGMCDRIIIMRDGSIAAELTKNEFNFEILYHHMTGDSQLF